MVSALMCTIAGCWCPEGEHLGCLLRWALHLQTHASGAFRLLCTICDIGTCVAKADCEAIAAIGTGVTCFFEVCAGSKDCVALLDTALDTAAAGAGASRARFLPPAMREVTGGAFGAGVPFGSLRCGRGV